MCMDTRHTRMISLLVLLVVCFTIKISATSSLCAHTWPKIDLILPVCLTRGRDLKRHYEVEYLFLESLALFWPLKSSNTSLNVIIDEEQVNSAAYREFEQTLNGVRGDIPGGAKISHTPQFPQALTGHHRQQHMMFWADNFTTSEYVGFVDTDAVFLTYVDYGDLFEGGKPVVNGRSGLHNGHRQTNVWKEMPQGTFNALGIKESMRCMSYFPVVIKTAHLREIRAFMAAHHNKSFDDAFFENVAPWHLGPFSQFGIMCTYLFHFHRDDYVWYVHSETPDWDGVNPPPNPGQDGNLSMFTPEMYFPKPRIATHARYRGSEQLNILRHPTNLKLVYQRGICLSPPLPRSEPVCLNQTEHIRKGYYDEMHRFEYFDWTQVNPAEKLALAFSQRQERIASCVAELAEWRRSSYLVEPYEELWG